VIADALEAEYLVKAGNELLNRATKPAEITRRLTQPLVLEDGRSPRVLRTTLLTISGFVIAAVVWAGVTQVREVTIAQGQIIPRGQIQAVQHLEGGIVAEIYVNEGMSVTAQQPLVRLRPESAVSDRSQFEARRASLKLQLIRLEAQSRGEVPDFGNLARQFPDLAAEQVKLYVSAVAQRQQEHASLLARVAQKRGEIAMLTSDLQTARAQVQLQLELLSIQEDLQKAAVGARKNLLEAKVLVQRAEGDAQNLQSKLATAKGALAEAESSLAETDAKALQKLGEERVKASSDLAETEQQLVKLADRFDRLLVRAPSDGIVLEIVPKSPGEVVRPGDLVARIVPTDRELVAEVRIDPKDSGHIRPEADAEIRLATYDSAIFGPVHGKVEYLSATTFSPPAGQPISQGQNAAEPYYRATIRLLQDHVGSGAMTYPIKPGMVLQAHIKTGSKSIIRYLFKPVFNSLDVAFTER
jgi:HlyD family secretion protein/adhesin transport system membrane fusion protein